MRNFIIFGLFTFTCQFQAFAEGNFTVEQARAICEKTAIKAAKKLRKMNTPYIKYIKAENGVVREFEHFYEFPGQSIQNYTSTIKVDFIEEKGGGGESSTFIVKLEGEDSDKCYV